MKSILKKPMKTRTVFIILSIICMIMIFRFSSEDSGQSTGTSGRVIRFVFGIFVPHFRELAASKQAAMVYNAQFIVRKLAHFTIYAMLGFCVSFAFGRRKFLSRMTAEAQLAAVLYAVSDEIHQSHVPGRSCELRDVFIDSCGAFTGILGSFAVLHLIHYFKKRRESQKNS